MLKIAGFISALVVSAAVVCCAAEPAPKDIEAKFSKLLRNTMITSVKTSPVNGLYEVVAGPNVFYYSPEGEGHLVFGQIVDKDGNNLTAEVQNKLHAEFDKIRDTKTAELLKTLPLNKAVKVGNGPNTIIEFTDPDCPFCRRVDKFLSSRTDVTRYVFLYPLEQLHPNSKAKAVYILSSKDKESALRRVFSGKYDNGELPIPNSDMPKHPEEVKLLAGNMKIGQELGVQGTPMLFVNGSLVNGADFKRISQLLKL